MAFALFALVLLLSFVSDNDKSVTIGYLGARGRMPLGVALLLAAVFGVLLVVIPATARIIQLRMVAHRHRRRARPVMQCSPVKLTESRKPRGSWSDVVVAGSGPAFRP